MIQVPMTYLGRRGCRIGEYALITVERHKYQSDSSYPIHNFPFLHYVIIMVSESLLHSQILFWRYVSMQNKSHNAAHTLNGEKARLSHSIKGITCISMWTSWYCKAFVSHKGRLRSFFSINYRKSSRFCTWAI